MLRWSDEARTVELSVRDLVGHSAEHPSLVMSARARAKLGIEAHEFAGEANRRAEVRWRHVAEVRGWRCVVNARLDGLVDELDGTTLVEELKSVAVGAEALADHPISPSWIRQLGLYLHIATAMHQPTPRGQLRLVSLLDGSQRVIPVEPEAGLAQWLDAWLGARVRARELWLARLGQRRGTSIPFPHPELRAGQAEIVAACTDAVHRGDVVAIDAPTGLGKTAPVLVGVLRAAMPLDRGVFWATARGTQRWIVERTLAELAFQSAELRTVVVAARAELCAACSEGTCEATAELAELDALDALRSPTFVELRADAARQACCPWALAVLFAATLADVVIADLNYAFDPDIYLRPLFGTGAGRAFAVVVDEAHQLPERAKDWATAELTAAACDSVDTAYPSASELPFRNVAACIRKVVAQAPTAGAECAPLPSDALNGLRAAAADMDGLAILHAQLGRPPAEDPWRRLHQAVTRFAHFADHEGEEVVSFAAENALHLVCRDPSFLLKPRFAAMAGVIASSATLEPAWYWRDRCGVDRDQFRSLSLPSPFPPENRCVAIARTVSTTLKDRPKEHPRIATLLDASAAVVPGNVAFFFGSYDVLRDLEPRMALPGRTRLVQTPSMNPSERAALADQMKLANQALFAVLGGAFGESIDLPSGALSAAFIVGPSLSPPSIASQLTQAYLERKYDDGFGLATIHPGMVRVVQAAGRVVRHATDRGAIVLVCRRFQQYEYQRYLPKDYAAAATSDVPGLLRAFFGRAGG